MRINEDYIDNISSDTLQTHDDEMKPRNYENFDHRIDVSLTSMKYRLLGSDKFDMNYINRLILIMKKAPYVPDFVIEVQNGTTLKYVDYDPMAGNYKDFSDFHKTITGEEVFYRFGFELDKNTPFGWFVLLLVKVVRLLNSTYSSKWINPDASALEYRYNALLNVEFDGESIVTGDMKIDDPVNPHYKLLGLYNRWRDSDMLQATERDTKRILDSWNPVYKEDYGLLPLSMGRPIDVWWSLVSYYHYQTIGMKHSLIIGSYVQDMIILKMSVIMKALEKMDYDAEYSYQIEKCVKDCEQGHSMIFFFDSKLTHTQLFIMKRVLLPGGDVEVFVDCPEWDIQEMISYFQRNYYASNMLSLKIHIQRIGGLTVGKTLSFSMMLCNNLIIDNEYFSYQGMFKSPDMKIEITKKDKKQYEIKRLK